MSQATAVALCDRTESETVVTGEDEDEILDALELITADVHYVERSN